MQGAASPPPLQQQQPPPPPPPPGQTHAHAHAHSRTQQSPSAPPRRRVNGCQCPWHPLQALAWLALLLIGGGGAAAAALHWPASTAAPVIAVQGVLALAVSVLQVIATLSDTTHPKLRPSTDGEAPPLRAPGEDMFCPTCRIHVGRRVKHCNVCVRCVDTFDHHCDWLNNCVGRENYRVFIAYVCVTLGANLYALALGVTVVAEAAMGSPGGNAAALAGAVAAWVQIVVAGVCAVVATGVGGFLTHLVLFHAYINWKGMTTYEWIVSVRLEKADKRIRRRSQAPPPRSCCSCCARGSASAVTSAKGADSGGGRGATATPMHGVARRTAPDAPGRRASQPGDAYVTSATSSPAVHVTRVAPRVVAGVEDEAAVGVIAMSTAASPTVDESADVLSRSVVSPTLAQLTT